MTSTFTPGQNATRVFTLAAALPAGQGCEHAGVLEYRIDFGPGYRIYFGKDGDALVPPWRGHEEGSAARHRRRSRAMEGLQAAEVAGELRMPLTRAFKETVQVRIRQDRKYRKELLREGVECLLAGDLDTGKAILRDYVNATIGFEKLSRLTGRPAKSLMRMLGPRGNPHARNLFEVIGQLQRIEGLHFELSLRTAS
jgi:putative component of toxin-antitoxin plasmid stabilization module